jgi:hypothetical protein
MKIFARLRFTTELSQLVLMSLKPGEVKGTTASTRFYRSFRVPAK